METRTENNGIDVVVGKSAPIEVIEGNKDKLPKIVLPRGERLYIGLQELRSMHEQYYVALSEMREGTAFASAELKSKMESAISIAYDEEIQNTRLKNQLEAEVERQRQISFNTVLKPSTWRNWWWIFKVHRNEAQILLEELIGRQASEYLQNKQRELPDSNKEEITPYAILIAQLSALLPRMRKTKREELDGIINELSASYESKCAEAKQCAEELKTAKAKYEEEKARADELSEMVAEFIEESKEAKEDEEETIEDIVAAENEEQKEEKADEVEGLENEELSVIEEQSEPADEEEGDGLYYDELLEGDK